MPYQKLWPGAIALIAVGVAVGGAKSAFIAAICFIAATAMIAHDILKPLQIRARLFLFLRYPQTFDNWAGSILKENESRKKARGMTLRRPYEKGSVSLVLGVGNENQGWPLEHSMLYVEFLDENLRVACGGRWQIEATNKRYSYRFPEPIIDLRGNANHPLEIVAPGPQAYRLRCTITGKWIRPITVPFHVDLY